MDLKKTYDIALKRIDEKAFNEAILLLEVIMEQYPESNDLFKVYLQLGFCYGEIGKYEKSVISFQNSLEINANFEVASLGLYLAYAELDLTDNAIQELSRFLNNHKADLYKTTLEELLEGLENGYTTKHEKVIKNLAKKNGLIPR